MHACMHACRLQQHIRTVTTLTAPHAHHLRVLLLVGRIGRRRRRQRRRQQKQQHGLPVAALAAHGASSRCCPWPAGCHVNSHLIRDHKPTTHLKNGTTVTKLTSNLSWEGSAVQAGKEAGRHGCGGVHVHRNAPVHSVHAYLVDTQASFGCWSRSTSVVSQHCRQSWLSLRQPRLAAKTAMAMALCRQTNGAAGVTHIPAPCPPDQPPRRCPAGAPRPARSAAVPAASHNPPPPRAAALEANSGAHLHVARVQAVNEPRRDLLQAPQPQQIQQLLVLLHCHTRVL